MYCHASGPTFRQKTLEWGMTHKQACSPDEYAIHVTAVAEVMACTAHAHPFIHQVIHSQPAVSTGWWQQMHRMCGIPRTRMLLLLDAALCLGCWCELSKMYHGVGNLAT